MSDGRDALARRLSDLARDLQERRGVEATLDGIVRAAVDTVPGADHAGVSQVEGRRTVRTTAGTGDLVYEVDRAQYASGQGPCLDALFTDRMVRVPDVAADPRWPDFTRRIQDLDVGSMLAILLWTDADRLAALNLYAVKPHAFDEESEQVGALFASHAAVALADARRIDQLTHAVQVRDLIGQAKGILMERHRITGAQAFGVLVRASQDTNTKLADVARYLVETGELAGGRREQ